MKDIEVAVKITDRCEKMCSHCCECSNPYGHSMPFDYLVKVLKNIRKNSDLVGFTGGEPVLYRDGEHDFIDVINVCDKIGLLPTVMCGGTYDNKEYNHIFDNISGLRFAVSFNLFREHWKEVFLTAIEMVKRKNIVSIISILYSRKNKNKTLKEFNKLNKKLKLDAVIDKGEITYIGRALTLKPKWVKIDLECELENYEDYLLIDMNGTVLPCCGVIDPIDIYKQGWNGHLQATQDLKMINKKARYFCHYKCKFNKNRRK